MTTKSINHSISAVAAVLLGLVAVLVASAPAGAEPPPVHEVAPADDERHVPELVDPWTFEIVPLAPTADVYLDCEATQPARVFMGNPTADAVTTETYLDGALVDSASVGAGFGHNVPLDLIEDHAHHVVVTASTAGPLVDEIVTLDCLGSPPEPAPEPTPEPTPETTPEPAPQPTVGPEPADSAPLVDDAAETLTPVDDGTEAIVGSEEKVEAIPVVLADSSATADEELAAGAVVALERDESGPEVAFGLVLILVGLTVLGMVASAMVRRRTSD